MGFCYTHDGKLCCDKCGNNPSRRHRCPAGWCQAYALCKECYATLKKSGRWTEIHCKCAEYAAKFKAEQDAEAALFAAGYFLRVSALSTDDGRVHVIFANGRFQGRETKGYYMSKATYDSIPLCSPATVADYEKFGSVEPAPDEFSTGRTDQTVHR